MMLGRYGVRKRFPTALYACYGVEPWVWGRFLAHVAAIQGREQTAEHSAFSAAI
jgi:hypothetical protein